MELRRRALIGGAGAAMVGLMAWPARDGAAKARFPVALSDAQWRQRLSPQAYSVLRQANTERAGSSPLNREKRPGVFACAGCGQRLFSSRTKFDSGTGWPSFWAPLKGGVGTKPDTAIPFLTRTEVHCARCGGHLGHVFDDGPAPTGKRYCMNGAALRFIAA